MAVLLQDIASSTSARTRLVGDIKVQTGQMLRGFGRERRAVAKTLHASLAMDRANRSAEVMALRDEAIKICEDFRLSHAQMGQALRLSLLESRASVIEAVNSMRTDTDRKYAELALSRRHRAKDQQVELANHRTARAQAAADLLQQLHAARPVVASPASAPATGMLVPTIAIPDPMPVVAAPPYIEPVVAAEAAQEAAPEVLVVAEPTEVSAPPELLEHHSPSAAQATAPEMVPHFPKTVWKAKKK